MCVPIAGPLASEERSRICDDGKGCFGQCTRRHVQLSCRMSCPARWKRRRALLAGNGHCRSYIGCSLLAANVFCELQEELGGVNPSTLSSRLKMLEDEGLITREQVSSIPPHVAYSLTSKGRELAPVVAEIAVWSQNWLCNEDKHLINPQAMPA